MKNFTILTLVALIAFAPLSIAKADLLTDYGVNNINDNAGHDTAALYQLFNNYFSEQLTSTSEGLYSSSNDLFNARGLDPNSAWVTNNSKIVGAFKVAGYEHNLSISDRNSSFSEKIFSSPSSDINPSNSKLSITDLSESSVNGLADGMILDFELEAKSPYRTENDYVWSSDPTKNSGMQGTGVEGDGMIHMIAIDITKLYNLKHGTDHETVYMFGFEDMHFTDGTGGWYSATADGDYQDFVVIMTNVNSVPTNVPEPATWMMFLIGGAGTSVMAWRKRKLQNKK